MNIRISNISRYVSILGTCHVLTGNLGWAKRYQPSLRIVKIVMILCMLFHFRDII